jgi:hypothetical protein
MNMSFSSESCKRGEKRSLTFGTMKNSKKKIMVMKIKELQNYYVKKRWTSNGIFSVEFSSFVS